MKLTCSEVKVLRATWSGGKAEVRCSPIGEESPLFPLLRREGGAEIGFGLAREGGSPKQQDLHLAQATQGPTRITLRFKSQERSYFDSFQLAPGVRLWLCEWSDDLERARGSRAQSGLGCDRSVTAGLEAGEAESRRPA